MEKFLENLKKKKIKKGSKWNSTYRVFSEYIFENLLFCPFFSTLTNKYICKKKIYIDLYWSTNLYKTFAI